MSITESIAKVLQEALHNAILEGDREEGVHLTEKALQDGITPIEFFQQVVSPVVEVMGDQFAKLEIFLPELMRAGMVVKALQERVLEPAILKMGGGQAENAGKVVIGTCQGDIHDIGKNMVALMLQVNGFKVTDLGTNVTARAFIDAAKREDADIIAMSTLLTTSMPFIKDMVELLKGFGLRDRFAVVVGGAPITQQWVENAGVDGFGEDAVEAVETCRKIIKARREQVK